jgi:hypothetical protein
MRPNCEFKEGRTVSKKNRAMSLTGELTLHSCLSLSVLISRATYQVKMTSLLETLEHTTKWIWELGLRKVHDTRIKAWK